MARITLGTPYQEKRTEECFKKLIKRHQLTSLSLVLRNTNRPEAVAEFLEGGEAVLVFDTGGNEYLPLLRESIIEGRFPTAVALLFALFVAEDCYANGRMGDALYFMEIYLHRIGSNAVLARRITDAGNSDTAFLMQAFYLAREVYRFYLRQDNERLYAAIGREEAYFENLYRYRINLGSMMTTEEMDALTDNRSLLLECALDAEAADAVFDIWQDIGNGVPLIFAEAVMDAQRFRYLMEIPRRLPDYRRGLSVCPDLKDMSVRAFALRTHLHTTLGEKFDNMTANNFFAHDEKREKALLKDARSVLSDNLAVAARLLDGPGHEDIRVRKEQIEMMADLFGAGTRVDAGVQEDEA